MKREILPTDIPHNTQRVCHASGQPGTKTATIADKIYADVWGNDSRL